VATTALSAQTPKVYYACYVPFVGTVYRIKEPGLSDNCLGPSSGPLVNVPFSWTDGLGALRVGDGASGDLSGTFPNPTVAKLRGVGLATSAPTNGQVLTFDGTNWSPVTPATVSGTSSNTPSTLVQRDGSGGFAAGALTLAGKIDQTSVEGLVARGTLSSGGIPATGAGVRFMWYPGKAALRAGRVNGVQWDDTNIGVESIALGLDALAIGSASSAFGHNAQAHGQNAIALGYGALATGFADVAIGAGVASGGSSIAIASQRRVALLRRQLGATRRQTDSPERWRLVTGS